MAPVRTTATRRSTGDPQGRTRQADVAAVPALPVRRAPRSWDLGGAVVAGHRHGNRRADRVAAARTRRRHPRRKRGRLVDRGLLAEHAANHRLRHDGQRRRLGSAGRGARGHRVRRPGPGHADRRHRQWRRVANRRDETGPQRGRRVGSSRGAGCLEPPPGRARSAPARECRPQDRHRRDVRPGSGGAAGRSPRDRREHAGQSPRVPLRRPDQGR